MSFLFYILSFLLFLELLLHCAAVTLVFYMYPCNTKDEQVCYSFQMLLFLQKCLWKMIELSNQFKSITDKYWWKIQFWQKLIGTIENNNNLPPHHWPLRESFHFSSGCIFLHSGSLLNGFTLADGSRLRVFVTFQNRAQTLLDSWMETSEMTSEPLALLLHSLTFTLS